MTVDRARLTDWIERYERLWRTAGTAELHELFADRAVYSTEPFAEPVVGLAALADFWERERLGPDEEFEMQSEIVAAEGAVGVVRVEVHYGPPRVRRYRDLWIVELDGEGRCARFEEWPFWPGHGASPG